MREYAGAIRSIIRKFGFGGNKIILSNTSTRNAQTGDIRYSTSESKTPVTYFTWPDEPRARSEELTISRSALVSEGSRIVRCAVLGGDPWDTNDILEDANGKRYIVRSVQRYPSHVELLLEAS